MLDLLALILTVAGLCLFETIRSIDNAIINAEVLGTMGSGRAGDHLRHRRVVPVQIGQVCAVYGAASWGLRSGTAN
ncbi:hypothetical protein HWN36_09255 [Methanofollis tationis]|uniref:Uncharacterized protein n=1 Tax=Methanofollis tationis TaxID=81417 RepID=A0A7K4HQG4_9EURY|nr:hypothetical protein [Methanofollis tationis]NVO67486.1 hypothetical protein [Methanofollis tationis]